MEIEVVSAGPEKPPPGSRVVVQLLDTTYADAPAAVLAEEVGETADAEDDVVHWATLEVPDAPGAQVRVHVDVDGDGLVSSGDFVTTSAYAAEEDASPLRVVVQRV